MKTTFECILAVIIGVPSILLLIITIWLMLISVIKDLINKN